MREGGDRTTARCACEVSERVECVVCMSELAKTTKSQGEVSRGAQHGQCAAHLPRPKQKGKSPLLDKIPPLAQWLRPLSQASQVRFLAAPQFFYLF